MRSEIGRFLRQTPYQRGGVRVRELGTVDDDWIERADTLEQYCNA